MDVKRVETNSNDVPETVLTKTTASLKLTYLCTFSAVFQSDLFVLIKKTNKTFLTKTTTVFKRIVLNVQRIRVDVLVKVYKKPLEKLISFYLKNYVNKKKRV